MTIRNLFALALIFCCTGLGWFTLGTALQVRTDLQREQLTEEVSSVWGPTLRQVHPSVYYLTATSSTGRKSLQPTRSKVSVDLTYDPKKRGLLWYRTYGVRYHADYEITNPTPVAQTVYVRFELPGDKASFHDFSFQLGALGHQEAMPENGAITQAISLEPGQTAPLQVGYNARGLDSWRYEFGDDSRVRQFSLLMKTDFKEINFPVGTGSSTTRDREGNGWALEWSYPDVISAPAIGMDMPNVLNAGPVASRIAFFAPVSLLFFFTVILILGMMRETNLHPVNYFFLAAGFFAFQLLFAYLVDLVPLTLSFIIASVVSLLLVCGYIAAVGGRPMLIVAIPAQIAYMVLFSYSFFFDGLSGLTITIGAIATLALLMIATAKVDWATKFRRPAPIRPPHLPGPAPV